MEYVILALCILNISLIIALIFMARRRGGSSLSEGDLKKISDAQASQINNLGAFISRQNEDASKHFIEMLKMSLDGYEKGTLERLSSIDKTIEKSLDTIRNENNQRLEGIRQIVDEKLQKSIDDKLKSSFESIVLQIGNVNKAIGEIRSIANDVGSLKNVLAAGRCISSDPKYISVFRISERKLELNICIAELCLFADIKSEHDNRATYTSCIFIGECTMIFEALPLVQDMDILRNILYAGCWTRYEQLQQKRFKNVPANSTQHKEDGA
jgi:hypothetical protein